MAMPNRSTTPDKSFDFAIAEYGGCLRADPQRWVPEVARYYVLAGNLPS
jgi:hypothetical protein